MSKDFKRKATSALVLSTAVPTVFSLNAYNVAKALGEYDDQGRLLKKYDVNGKLVESRRCKEERPL